MQALLTLDLLPIILIYKPISKIEDRLPGLEGPFDDHVVSPNR